MLVSHLHQFVFLKTLKTGGTSVEMALQPWCQPAGVAVTETTEAQVSAEGIVGRRAPHVGDAVWYNHMPAREVRARLGEERWQRYCKFTIVRNPFDRVVSWFHFTGGRDLGADVGDVELIRRFRSWLADAADGLPEDAHIYTIDGRLAVDRVLRYERLQADLAELLDELNLQPVALPRMKARFRQRRIPYQRYYDDAARQRVEAVFADELGHFGYRFEAAQNA